MEELVLKDEMTVEALYLLKKLEKLEPGSEEHSRVVEDIVKIAKSCNECFKIESEANNEAARIESDRERTELERRKLTRVRADNIWTACIFGTLFVGGLFYEAKGYIVPAKFSKLIDIIPKSIKL